MTEPTIPDPSEATPERVDNTNALHRALVEHLIAETGVDVAPVVEAFIADGGLTADATDAAVAKGWIGRKAADDALRAAPVPVEEAVVKG